VAPWASSPAARSPSARSSRTSSRRLPACPLELSSIGELLALVDRGRPEFNLLQNFRSVASRIHYFIFDLLCCSSAIATCSILVFIRLRSTLIAIPAKLLVD
jgi:hypothetical protein